MYNGTSIVAELFLLLAITIACLLKDPGSIVFVGPIVLGLMGIVIWGRTSDHFRERRTD